MVNGFAVFAGPATTGKCGARLTWTVSKSTGSSDYDVLTISGIGPMTDYQEETAPWYADFGYDISQVVIEEGVTSIGAYAFFELFITEITLPNSLETIRTHAFQDCEVLRTVRIGTGLTKIEADAFVGSMHIGTIYCDIPKASQLTWDGNSSTQQFMPSKGTMFSVAEPQEWLKRFPNANVTFIQGSVAISGTGLRYELYYDNDEATLRFFKSGRGSTMIPEYDGVNKPSWHRYSELVENIILGEGVTDVGDWAFYGFTALKKLVIGKDVIHIGQQICENTKTPFTCIFEEGSRMEVLGLWTFAYSSLQSIVLPPTLKKIEKNVFFGTKVKTITIPTGVTSIGIGTFANCLELETVYLGSDVQSVGQGAFAVGYDGIVPETIKLNKLADVYCYADMNPNKWEFFDDNDFASYDSLLLYHPKHDHTPKLHILSTADINEWKKHFSGINVEIVADLRPHEAWAAWCADNATLYFGYGDVPFKGETYLGHTVTDVWSGIKVTGEPTGIGGTRPWNDIRRNIENVVFDKSFAEARPISCKNWFLNFTSLESVTGLEYLNTSWVISMYQMFNNSYSLKTLNLSTFDVSNVSNMDYMFSNSRSLTTIYASTDWNMGQVKDSYRMFNDCLSLKGAISYDADKTDIAYANPTTGYFTPTPTIELKDLEDNSEILAKYKGIRVNVNYDRVIRATENADGTWKSKAATVCLPYDLDLTAEVESGRIRVCKLWFVKDPTNEEIAQGERYEFIFSNTPPVLKAGQGYVVVVNEGELQFNANNVTISTEEKPASVFDWSSDEDSRGDWRGTLRNRSNEECTNNLVYSMSNDGDFRRISNTTERERGAWLAAFRAGFFANAFYGRNRYYSVFKKYVQGDGDEDPFVDLADNFEFDSDFSGYGDDDMVGIKTIEHSPLTNGHYYDLQGRRIVKSSNRKLPKGVYIDNGKKIIKK